MKGADDAGPADSASDTAANTTPAPTALAATSSGSRVINLTWTPPPDLDVTYQVYRGTTETGPFTAVGSPSLTASATDVVANGIAYTYVVRATTSGRDESVNSNTATAYSTQTPTLQGGGSVLPNWVPTDDAAGYVLSYKYETPNFPQFRSFPMNLKETVPNNFESQTQNESTATNCVPSYTLLEHRVASGRHQAGVTNGEACQINPCYFQNLQVKVQSVYASGLKSAESNVVTGFYQICD